MKKIIIALALILGTSSCVTYTQENLNLNLSITPKYSDLGSSKSINLTVIDGRKNNDLLGNKRIGDNLVPIKSNQNLSELTQNKISRDLEQNGFLTTNSDLADKFLEIKILTLNYNAYREFFIGTSKVEVLLKITAKNKVGGANYSTTQSFSLDKNHFIMPLITTDEKTINNALQEALDGVFSNQKLLEFLKN